MTRTDDRLSRAASAVASIRSLHHEAASYDAGFDGGEFSGPAHERAEQREIRAALAALGFTPESYNAELAYRTSERFAHFAYLLADEYDAEAEWEARTQRRNR